MKITLTIETPDNDHVLENRLTWGELQTLANDSIRAVALARNAVDDNAELLHKDSRFDLAPSKHGATVGRASVTLQVGPTFDEAEVRAALEAALSAADGDSNDEEIEALQECRDLLEQITGVSA